MNFKSRLEFFIEPEISAIILCWMGAELNLLRLLSNIGFLKTRFFIKTFVHWINLWSPRHNLNLAQFRILWNLSRQNSCSLPALCKCIPLWIANILQILYPNKISSTFLCPRFLCYFVNTFYIFLSTITRIKAKILYIQIFTNMP